MKMKPPSAQHTTRTIEQRRAIFGCCAVMLAVGLLWATPVPTLVALRFTAVSAMFANLTSLALLVRGVVLPESAPLTSGNEASVRVQRAGAFSFHG